MVEHVCVSMFGGLRKLSLSLSMSLARSTSLSGQLGWAKSEHGHTQTYLVEGGGTGASCSCSVTHIHSWGAGPWGKTWSFPFCFHTSRILLETLIHCWGFIWVLLDYFSHRVDNLCGYLMHLIAAPVGADTCFGNREQEEQQIDKNKQADT